MPQVQFIDKIVDVPEQKQRQVLMVQKTVEIPQILYIDKNPEGSEDRRGATDLIF